MPFSSIYGKITDLRNALFERGLFKSHTLGAPAISVGNITVGGTGKTPLVAFVAQTLIEKGEKVCILTRGYGRENPKQRVLVADGERILSDAKKSGDEPFELAQKLSGKAFIVADANRVAAAKFAIENFAPSVFVLDDAFQHRRARRDLDIVLLDATNPFGNEKTLPFGILREPLENLARADMIVISRANLVDNLINLKSRISNYNPNCPIITSENRIADLIELKEFHAKPLNSPQESNHKSQITNHKSLAFCALGNPENFFEMLRRENYDLAGTRKFPDHHRYMQNDVESVEAEAKRAGAGALLTTAKDAVKLAGLRFEIPCYVVESDLIFDDEKKLREMIDAVLIPKTKI